MRILFVTSNGGHLDQLMQLRPWWQEHDREWVTFDLPDARAALAGETCRWAHHPTTRNAPNALRNANLARSVLRDYRPDVVISAGAGVAVPFFVMARLLAIRTVYLESYDRIDLPTLTGRLCTPFTDAFLLQWERQRMIYPRGVVIGKVY